MKGKVFREPIFNGVVKNRVKRFVEIVKPQPIAVFSGVPLRGYRNQIGIKDIKPRFKVGEEVYIKEPYAKAGNGNIVYYFDNPFSYDIPHPYKSSNMPAEYARYFIDITGVRCERVQDMAHDDYFCEGMNVNFYGEFCTGAAFSFPPEDEYDTPQEAYAALFDHIHGKGAWERNPYVWVYEFRLTNERT